MWYGRVGWQGLYSLRRQPHVFALLVLGVQVQLLRSLFEQALGEEGAKHVDINTIDGFQVGRRCGSC
jgi:hypothetical protein